MLFWFLFCDDIPGYVKFCDDNLCDDILISLWWYCGDVVIQPHKYILEKTERPCIVIKWVNLTLVGVCEY